MTFHLDDDMVELIEANSVFDVDVTEMTERMTKGVPQPNGDMMIEPLSAL